uniref:Uncharacterized protein n=1 Tax=Oryza sativa subsp. japonica TaxID=39947 RepID=Q5W6M1_ORYSJ|nr:hypothetical protein [Oryza sativa Japonica Group]AAV44170.1 hypothetical protein [Oryza sativa Japonica Group]
MEKIRKQKLGKERKEHTTKKLFNVLLLQREHSGWGGERGNEARGRPYPGAIITIVFELPPLCRIWRASWREKRPPPRAVELCSSGVRELRGSSGKGEQLRGERAVVADREGELPRAGSGLHATTPPEGRADIPDLHRAPCHPRTHAVSSSSPPRSADVGGRESGGGGRGGGGGWEGERGANGGVAEGGGRWLARKGKGKKERRKRTGGIHYNVL